MIHNQLDSEENPMASQNTSLAVRKKSRVTSSPSTSTKPSPYRQSTRQQLGQQCSGSNIPISTGQSNSDGRVYFVRGPRTIRRTW
jgi:hypothetical protein